MKAPVPDKDQQSAREVRMVAFVIAGTMLLWMGAQYLGGAYGLEARFVFLFDFMALAAFFWALVVTYRIWRKRRN